MYRLQGSCHCAKIRIDFETERAPDAFEPRICSCEFCRRHGSAAIADPQGKLTLHIDPAHVPYRFGLGMTDFHVCNSCGAFVAASWSDGDRLFGVININVLENASAFSGKRVAVNFDAEDHAARANRRLTNWTPAIMLPE